MNICRNGGLGNRKSSSSSGMKIRRLKAAIKVSIVTLLPGGFSALWSLYLKEPGGCRVESDTCSAWLLNYRRWCQSMFVTFLPCCLKSLFGLGVVVFLLLLHLHALRQYIWPILTQLTHQKCCGWTDRRSFHASTFFSWVNIRLTRIFLDLCL